MNERYRQEYSKKAIDQRIGQLASEITAKYNGDDPEFADKPLFVALLLGAAPFASDLMRAIAEQAPEFNPELEYMRTSRYAHGNVPDAKVKITMNIAPDRIEKRNIIIVDDVLDMGETATAVREHLVAMGARFVELAVLVEKDAPRTTTIQADYVGFKAPNKWLVGMGMDDNAVAPEAHRWDSSIQSVNPEEPQSQYAVLGN